MLCSWSCSGDLDVGGVFTFDVNADIVASKSPTLFNMSITLLNCLLADFIISALGDRQTVGGVTMSSSTLVVFIGVVCNDNLLVFDPKDIRSGIGGVGGVSPRSKRTLCV